MASFELSPAYGRDYKSKKEVIEAWHAGKDFLGDHQLGFKPVNKEGVPRPSTVLLRYMKKTQVASLQIE
jgi:hypothetical protein